MLKFVSVSSGLVLLANVVETYYHRYPDSVDYNDVDFDSEDFEYTPHENHHHYHQQTPIRVVKKFIPIPAPAAPVAPYAIQKLDLTKNSASGSNSGGISHTLVAIVLALVGQFVAGLVTLVMLKLIVGMKAILVTNTISLSLALWKHLKKLKRKKKHRKGWHKPKPHKHSNKKRKKKHKNNDDSVDLSQEQIKQLLKLLNKMKKKNI
ncbi:uncharacterized protein LOC131430652 [Malaya genurostris]|uniref:uncharacterized protein LOC131430652 n=1 Tax=Malaya genurostris TaxID=325434 RepID=UPI0026F3BCF2|nr:uncharacterized protein LOC131430652 [Malaya genurostris]